MLTQEIRDHLLVDELQLGQTLNEAVANGFSAQFNLLVSMLSDDVRDQPWVTDPVAQEKQTEDLRKKFALGNQVRLQSDDEDLKRADLLGDYFRDGGLKAVHLLECINPEPLTLKHPEIPQMVMDNLPPLHREKILYEFNKGKIERGSLAYTDPKDVLDTVTQARELTDRVALAV